MSRDLTYIGGYLPLFAGSEVVRRSGALTQYPLAGLLGNLPASAWFLADSFISPPSDHNLVGHLQNTYSGTPNRGYTYVSGGTLTVHPVNGSLGYVLGNGRASTLEQPPVNASQGFAVLQPLTSAGGTASLFLYYGGVLALYITVTFTTLSAWAVSIRNAAGTVLASGNLTQPLEQQLPAVWTHNNLTGNVTLSMTDGTTTLQGSAAGIYGAPRVEFNLAALTSLLGLTMQSL